VYPPKTNKQCVTAGVCLNGVVGVKFSEQVNYLGLLVCASLKNDNDIHSQVKILCCAANKFKGTFGQCSTAVMTPCFVLIVLQRMPANCGAKTHSLVQARNQLGSPWGGKSFPRGAKNFWSMFNIFKLCPTRSSRWAKTFLGGLRPPWLRAWSGNKRLRVAHNNSYRSLHYIPAGM